MHSVEPFCVPQGKEHLGEGGFIQYFCSWGRGGASLFVTDAFLKFFSSYKSCCICREGDWSSEAGPSSRWCVLALTTHVLLRLIPLLIIEKASVASVSAMKIAH